MKPKCLKKGDRIAIVSLSSGILGETFIKHELALGIKRLKEFGLEPVFMPNTLRGLAIIKENPQVRAEDLKQAFKDPSIKAILCAIGGDDTYRTLPFLLEDEEFIQSVIKNPKIFLGFSDTTINHFMFYRLGLPTFYGQAFLPDFAELDVDMLPYTKEAFLNLFENKFKPIISSPIWYLERNDFSEASLGIPRKAVKETRGFEVLQGKGVVEGILLGGCLESICDILSGERYKNQKNICKKYHLFPSMDEWQNKILLLETSEEQPTPEEYEKMLRILKQTKLFENIKGILHGKPMDEKYYEEYKQILVEIIDHPNLPILFNVNVGHATPRCILPLQAKVYIDLTKKRIEFPEVVLD